MILKRPCVYILASRRNGTLYIGVTSDLALRIWQHKSNAEAAFVQDYGVHRLVFVEFHNSMETAILREKPLKKWRRTWKLELIESRNPQWRDFTTSWQFSGCPGPRFRGGDEWWFGAFHLFAYAGVRIIP
jgi:putative endonuclease